MRRSVLFFTLFFLSITILQAQVGKERERATDAAVARTERAGQYIDRLVVPTGQTYEVRSTMLEINILEMGDRAKIILKNPNTTLVVERALIGAGCQILGVGKNGANGQNGRNGYPVPSMPDARDGTNGRPGENGGAAPNLNLYIGYISFRMPLKINLLGGNGGAGGNGGEGGNKTIGCGKIAEKGTNGGDAGAGAFGGAGGKLMLVMSKGLSKDAIQFESVAGDKGNNGTPGEPGWVTFKCMGMVKKTRPGKMGKFVNSFMYTKFPPNTDPDFLEFPSPVPDPSAMDTVPLVLPPGALYSTVNAKLARALKACGYENLNYRWYKDGFAVFTGMEHITSEGVPLEGENRFSPVPVKFYQDPSLISYLKSLFRANVGYSRIIVFIVTDKGIGVNPGGIERSEALKWLTSSINRLPQEVGSRPYTKQHTLTALIYEFSRKENAGKVVFSEPSQISAGKHLQGAKLWSLLTEE